MNMRLTSRLCGAVLYKCAIFRIQISYQIVSILWLGGGENCAYCDIF